MSNRTIQLVTHVGSEVPDEVAFPLVLARMKRQTVKLENGCWQSTRPGNGNGYVQIFFRGKRIFQHRLSYIIHVGPIPSGRYVLHTCDNRKCWNPAHLWLGTISDNKQDELRKGRNYEANRDLCPRGHAYAEHGSRHGKNRWRHCVICQRGRQRMASGLWSEDEAYSVPPIPPTGSKRRRTASPDS